MQTLTIILDSNKLDNPDLDLRYVISDRIEEVTQGRIYHDGFDYMGENGSVMAIFHAIEEVNEADLPNILNLIRTETFLDNDLSKSAKVYFKDGYPDEGGDYSDCTLIFPAG